MSDEEMRYKQGCAWNLCGACKSSSGAQTIVVRQVLGEHDEQKICDMHVHLPEKKPAIEHIVDVFVKNLKVTSVDVIMDHVVVRGEFELKTIYVANLPGNPVHAMEMKRCKWTQDIGICGARHGMDAEANVCMEFVDYDVPEMTRAYKYKYHGSCSCSSSSSCDKPMYPPKFNFQMPKKKKMQDCCPPKDICEPPKQECCPVCPPKNCSLREFDVSVILRVNAKVIVDREVQVGTASEAIVNNQQGTLPEIPKG